MRIVHLSDLHFGHHDQQVADSLAAEIAGQQPDLVVVSGDFTQVGTEKEFKAARAFLDTIAAPIFTVPGNHDVPAFNMVRRLLDPYSHYRKYIHSEVEPFLARDGVAIAGIKTVRRMRFEFNWAHGRIDRAQLDELDRRFSAVDAAAVKIVVAHHPLLYPEGPMQKKMRRVDEADRALQRFADLGVRLVLSGHFHLSYLRRHEQPGAIREGAPPGPRQAASAPILVCQASSTISTRLRGQPNSYNLIDINNGLIGIRAREWHGEGWQTREQALANADEPTAPPIPVPATEPEPHAA